MKNIGESMGRGAAWMIAGRFANKFLGLISTFVLARWLLPDHFGIVMIATSILAALELMGAFSFDTVLIQLQDATREHYDTVWTIGILFGALFATILAGGAWFFADFYNEDRLVLALLVIALTKLISSFANVGVIDFRKNLQFGQDFYYGIAGKLVTVSTTLTTAYFLRDHRALLVGVFSGSVFGVALSYARHPFRPRFSLAKRQDIFKSASWLFVHNIVYFLNTRSADFIVAKLSGSAGLGIFNLANEVASVPVTEIAAPVNRAAMPAYAKLQNEPLELVRVYQSTLAATALVLIPAAILIGTIAPLFVPAILGNRWLDVIQLIPILAMAALPTALVNNNGVVLLSLGESKASAILSTLRAGLLLITLFIFTSLYGVMGAAFAMLLTSVSFMAVSHIFLARKIRIKISSCLLVCLRPALASLPMGLLVIFLSNSLMPSIPNLLGTIIFAGIVYVVSIAVLWMLAGKPDSHEREILRFVRAKITATR
ncbi:MAG: oligosaccharide flippase family protein [Rhodoferax sp.]|uniref:oligosaccharide flippase family protein n=1 Tax=Rhodoferax sp. TaxID=50421 RepID=UPI0027291FAE|nr:oligosaccharide flippase family protein [Rhodoferax sp.]MDO8450880.1 oligosaccharide flippase family protein [Rhodoferax sp.]